MVGRENMGVRFKAVPAAVYPASDAKTRGALDDEARSAWPLDALKASGMAVLSVEKHCLRGFLPLNRDQTIFKRTADVPRSSLVSGELWRGW